MFNFLKALQYLSVAAQAGALVESTKLSSASDYANLGLNLTTIFVPNMQSNGDYQTAQALMGSLVAAESGQTGVISTIPFQSHNQKLKITVTVGPA